MLVVYSPFILSMFLHHECDITVIKNHIHIPRVSKVALRGVFWRGGGVLRSAIRVEMDCPYLHLVIG